MDEQIRKGRLLIIIAIIVFIAPSIFDMITSLIYISNVGITELISRIFSLCLSLVFVYFLYNGHKWARILLGILTLLSSFIPLFMIIEAIVVELPISIFIVYIGFRFIIDIVMGILLFTSKNIKLFMEYQRNKQKLII